jgi:hypothetical protein
MFFLLSAIICIVVSLREITGDKIHFAPNAKYEIGVESEKYMQKLQQEQDLFNLEYNLAKIESLRMQTLGQRVQSQGYEIQGFYHTSKWKDFWPRVIAEQLFLLDGKRKFPYRHRYAHKDENFVNKNYDPRHDYFYKNMTLPYSAYQWANENEFPNDQFASLLNITTQLNINIVGENKQDYEIIRNYIQGLPLKHQSKITYGWNQTIGRWVYNGFSPEKKLEHDAKTDLSTGEYSTVMQLHGYCQRMKKQNKKALVYYFHNKGTCCVKNSENYQQSNPVANWREYMTAMNLEFPSICLRAIHSKKYVACGVENQDGHFSGNFWWADCAHVAALPPLRLKYDFGEAEYFVLRGHQDFGTLRNFGFKCGYSIYNCGVNLYDFECPRWKYREQILTKSIPHMLTPNNVWKKDENTGKCRELLKKGKPYWDMPQEVRNAVN